MPCILQDRGDLPLDPVYEQVLEGLHLVAKHAALPLLDHFLGWRKEALVKATRAGGEIIVLRKRVSTGLGPSSNTQYCQSHNTEHLSSEGMET